MTTPIVGKLYVNSTTGMVVEAVSRYPYETSLLVFPGRVLFAGKTARWDIVGRRIANLKPRDFKPIRVALTRQLNLFSLVAAGRSA